jgi:glycosyltransferase involved in cell wall biosynthesis
MTDEESLHVVHVYDGHEQVYNGRGSVPGVVWNLARETVAAGHEVTVIERQWNGLGPEAVHEGVRFDRLNLSTGADEPWQRVPYELVDSPVKMAQLVGDRTNFALTALRRLQRIECDIIHVHLPFAANVLVTVAPWLRQQMVYTAHLGELRLGALGESGEQQTEPKSADNDGINTPAVLKHLSPDIYLAQRVAHTAVLNEGIREEFVSRGIPAERVSVVPNGVNVERFADVESDLVESVRETYDIEWPITLLFVGTVMPRKGVRELIVALDAVVHEQEYDNVGLVIAGEADLDEGYVREVKEMIASRGLGGHVRITGFVPEKELPALYALADMLVVPSLEEGFGMTAIEGLAAGTPVIATRVGGLPCIIDDSTHGALVEPGAADELAEGIAGVIDDRADWEQITEKAHERAERYSWSSVATSLIHFYRHITIVTSGTFYSEYFVAVSESSR